MSAQQVPAYWNPNYFKPGQPVMYGEFEGTIIRHYFEGMWEVRLPGGPACYSGADLVPVAQPAPVFKRIHRGETKPPVYDFHVMIGDELVAVWRKDFCSRGYHLMDRTGRYIAGAHVAEALGEYGDYYDRIAGDRAIKVSAQAQFAEAFDVVYSAGLVPTKEQIALREREEQEAAEFKKRDEEAKAAHQRIMDAGPVLLAALKSAREVLDDTRGNINPERGYADELEADVEKAIAEIDAAITKATGGVAS